MADGKFMCTKCGYHCTSRYSLKRHVSRKHVLAGIFPCSMCVMTFRTEDNRQSHYRHNHRVHLSFSELRKLAPSVRQDGVNVETEDFDA